MSGIRSKLLRVLSFVEHPRLWNAAKVKQSEANRELRWMETCVRYARRYEKAKIVW